MVGFPTGKGSAHWTHLHNRTTSEARECYIPISQPNKQPSKSERGLPRWSSTSTNTIGQPPISKLIHPRTVHIPSKHSTIKHLYKDYKCHTAKVDCENCSKKSKDTLIQHTYKTKRHFLPQCHRNRTWLNSRFCQKMTIKQALKQKWHQGTYIKSVINRHMVQTKDSQQTEYPRLMVVILAGIV